MTEGVGEERIIGYVGATLTGKRTLFSGLSNVHCILYFTTRRVSVEKTRSQRGERRVPGWMEADPKDLKSLDMQRIIDSGRERFFSIPHSSMSRVAIGRKWLNPRMSIITAEKVHRFVWFWPYVGVDRVQRMARYYLPPQVLVERVKGSV